MQVAKERVKTLDRLRGLSIVYMLLSHILLWTLMGEVWWYYASFPLHDLLGGPMFVFVSGAGLTLSIRRHPENPAWMQHLRSVLIFGLGIVTNLGSMYRATLWGWSILFALGIFRLVGYYAVKLRPWVRIILIGVILVIARPLLLALVGADFFPGSEINLYPANPNPAQVIAYLLYSMPNQNTFFPYFGFFLAGTLFVDLVVGRPKESQRIWRHRFLFVGILLVAGGLLAGLLIMTNIDLGDTIILWLNTSGRTITEIPSWASRGTLAWSMIMLGMQFLLGLLFLKLEHQVYQNRFLTIYGEFSLTIFAANAPIFLVRLHSLPLLLVLPVAIFFIILTWHLCTIWYKKAKGKYSIEWLLNYVVKFFSHHITRAVNAINGKSKLHPKSSLGMVEDDNGHPPLIEKPLSDAPNDA